MKVRNTFIIFIVSGFWHGANWTFIVWGALNAVFFLPLLLMKRNRQNLNDVAEGKFFPPIGDLLKILLTFSLTVLAWIFFRAENIGHAVDYIAGIFNSNLFSIPDLLTGDDKKPLKTILFVLVLILIEWVGRSEQYGIERLGWKLPRLVRWSAYWLIIVIIILNAGEEQEFIYFQF